MIDQGRFIREFGPHILHCQAKDVMIDRDGLYERGIVVGRHRLAGPAPARPGRRRLGRDLLHLYRVGYDGDCIIEHEDRGFEGTDELVKRGFLLARDVLRPYMQVSPMTRLHRRP